MKAIGRKTIELPLYGRTYSLYGGQISSSDYYKTIQSITDYYIKQFQNADQLLQLIQTVSKKKSYFRKKINRERDPMIASLLKDLDSKLSSFTGMIETHLDSLSIMQKTDSILATTREQYYLYMMEIELVNRINKERFLASNFKIAFLPHCIKDLSRECLSKPDEIDYVCKGCSKICNINRVSKLLRKNDVSPYIWMEAELNPLFKNLKKKYGNFGVLGIACIPELIKGMRTCLEKNIPVTGIPIDANRCARWMGKFHDNTVNLKKLEELLT
jgi:uncharacterized protein